VIRVKMRKFALYFISATAFAVLTVVFSKEWAIDSPLEDELNGFVQRFNSLKVSIFA